MPEYIDDPTLQQNIDRREEKKADELKVATDAKNFLLKRTLEYVKLPIANDAEVLAIEVRSRLTKAEEKRFSNMFILWENALAGDINAFNGNEDVIAEFLEYITKDKSLDKEFWLNPELDEQTPRDVLQFFFTQPAANWVRIVKFRNV